MLASDLIIGVRASRSISGEQLGRLERMVFATGVPGRDQLELLLLLDTYLERKNPGWAELLERAAHAAAGHETAVAQAKAA
jgi:hypothetical protein